MLLFIFLFIVLITVIFYVKRGGEDKVFIIDKVITFEPLYSRMINKGLEEAVYNRHVRELISYKNKNRRTLFTEMEFYILFLRNLFTFAKSSQEQLIQDFLSEKQKVVVVNAGDKSSFCNLFLAHYFSSFIFHYYGIEAPKQDLTTYTNLKIFDTPFSDTEAEKYKQDSMYLDSLFSEYVFTTYPTLTPYPPSIIRKLNDVKNKMYVIFVPDFNLNDPEKDFLFQERWVDLLKPDAISVKIKLPEEPGKTKYFSGDLFTEPRIGPNSREARLIYFTPGLRENSEGEKSYKKISYNNESFNRKLFYFQRHNRNAFHEYSLFASSSKKKTMDIFNKLSKGIKGLCHCHDCWSEIEICKFFLQSFDPEYSFILASLASSGSYLYEKNENEEDLLITKIINLMNTISKETHSSLDISPHNLFVNETDINKKITAVEQITKKYNSDSKKSF